MKTGSIHIVSHYFDSPLAVIPSANNSSLIMPTPPTDIANLYNILGAGELSRLDTHPVELLVTLRTISEALPPAPQRIADVGGGPGRYAFALADQGHAVDLVDLSPGLIQLAQVEQDKRKAAAGKENLLQSLSVGNALDPTILQPGIYDAVLLLGPLYHLVEASERVDAVANAVRLAKPNGVLFVAFVSIAAHLRDVAMREPGRLVADREFYAKYVCPFFITLPLSLALLTPSYVAPRRSIREMQAWHRQRPQLSHARGPCQVFFCRQLRRHAGARGVALAGRDPGWWS